ncbi:MAG: L,D-transpeptidase family protein [Sphingomonadaceae bacterium]|nr:L,D-transpeptidase family protein [Sphingomonadaceae bacterium]
MRPSLAFKLLLFWLSFVCVCLARPALAEPPAVTTTLGLDTPLATGEYVWDEDGAPPGAIRIVVDLQAERLYVYRGGAEIGRSSIISGWGDKPTPLGEYPILMKDRYHVSGTYWGAPMPYTLRLTRDGVSIHGTEQVADDLATHGCIGLPKGFAAILFDVAKVGDCVLITNGWMTDQYAQQ